MGSLLRETARLLTRPCVLLVLGVQTSCAAFSPTAPVPQSASMPQAALPTEVAAQIQAVSHKEPAPSASVTCPASATGSQPACASPFVDASELSVEALIEQVLARNPSLAQMIAVWQAASARYPQVISLEDPMLAATIGPETIAPDDAGTEFAYRLEISQKLPFPGKLKLRGENALAEASAAGRDVDGMRLQLVESARMAYYDYYLVDRALAVNDESLRLLHDFRKNAETRYQTGLVSEQDVLQAAVELGREEDRRLELEQMRQVTVARINTLMHFSPDSPLPPPPKEVAMKDGLPDAQTLRATALARRPDLQALADRIAAEEAALGLAHKEFYPDFEPFLMYDRFMGNVSDNRDLATMLGLRLNLPVYRQRRYAAVAEAEARIAQRRAELARLSDQVNYQVQEAYTRVQRSEKSVRLYRDSILRAAEANVRAAQSAYITAKIPFLSLIEAERNVISLRDRYFEAVADYFRRLAALERAAGGPLLAQPSLAASEGATEAVDKDARGKSQ